MRIRFLPVALIVLGVTLLLGNLGIVPKPIFYTSAAFLLG